MRFLALALLAVTLGGCCGGSPTFTLRNPLQMDSEPKTVAAPRLMPVTTYMAPQYSQPVQMTPMAQPCAPVQAPVQAPAYPCN